MIAKGGWSAPPFPLPRVSRRGGGGPQCVLKDVQRILEMVKILKVLENLKIWKT